MSAELIPKAVELFPLHPSGQRAAEEAVVAGVSGREGALDGFCRPCSTITEVEEKNCQTEWEQWSFNLTVRSPAATRTRCFRGRCEILVMGNYGIISLQGSCSFPHIDAQQPVYAHRMNSQALSNVYPT